MYLSTYYSYAAEARVSLSSLTASDDIVPAYDGLSNSGGSLASVIVMVYVEDSSCGI